MSHNGSMEENMDIIKRIRSGDDTAFEQLLKDHHRMIYSIINSFSLESGDFAIDKHDLYQEASLALYEAVFRFEEDRSTRFSSYAYIVIRNRVVNVLRHYYRTYREEGYSIDVNENPDCNIAFAVGDQPFLYHREQEFLNHYHRFMNGLSVEDRKIIEMRRRNLSYQQISDRLNIKKKRVDNRLASLKRSIREFIESEGI